MTLSLRVTIASLKTCLWQPFEYPHVFCYLANKLISQTNWSHNWIVMFHRNLDVMRWKKRKVKRLAVARSRTQDTPDLSRPCSAAGPQQPDNHQPSQSSIYTAQVVQNASVTHLAATVVRIGGCTGVSWVRLSVTFSHWMSVQAIYCIGELHGYRIYTRQFLNEAEERLRLLLEPTDVVVFFDSAMYGFSLSHL